MSTLTKEQLLDSNPSSISTQQALVDRLIPKKVRLIKRVIPGGKSMLTSIDKNDIPGAVFNWLRGCGGFTEVVISWAKEPEKFNPKLVRVQAYERINSKPFWEQPEGRKMLAKDLAKQINSRKFVYITAKPDGIYVAEDTTGKFGPTITVTKELQKQEEYKDHTIGTKLPSPDWEPYIEFTPSNRSRYTNYNPKEETS